MDVVMSHDTKLDRPTNSLENPGSMQVFGLKLVKLLSHLLARLFARQKTTNRRRVPHLLLDK